MSRGEWLNAGVEDNTTNYSTCIEQFSVFSLKMETVDLTNSDGSWRNVLAATTPPALYSADSLLRALYRLKGPSNTALADVDSSPRQLALSLGKELVDVTWSKDCEKIEDCPARTAQLNTLKAKQEMSAQDFLALRLVQKEDEGNVLWQYGFADIAVYIRNHKGKDVANIQIGNTSRAHARLQPANAEQERRVKWKMRLPRFGGQHKRDYAPWSSTDAAENVTPRFVQERRRTTPDGPRPEDHR